MQKRERIAILILLVLLSGVFAGWAFTAASSGAGLLAAALCCALFGGLFFFLVPNFFAALAAPPVFPDAALGARSLRFSRRHPWVGILVWFLLSRLLMYALAYAIHTMTNGYTGGLLDTLKTLWLRTDSPSYLGIAENGYVTSGDARFHIVFFPLYPLCIRAMWFITRDYFVAAMAVSNLFGAASAIACYELTALELDREDALRSVRYMLLLPAAFFLGAPMGESLFLFLCLLCLYFARRRKFLWACVVGALAGFARLPGVLLFVPVALEMFFELAQLRKAEPQKFGPRLRACVLCLLILPLGLLGYLYVNYSVTGSALTFLTYQREHWSQGLGLFFATPAYQLGYALNAEARLLWGLYLPNLAAIFGALYLVLRAARDMRASYLAYFLVYFAIAIGATWLLSAPRYLCVCYPLILACALRAREPSRDILLTVVLGGLFIGYMGLYVLGYPVY